MYMSGSGHTYRCAKADAYRARAHSPRMLDEHEDPAEERSDERAAREGALAAERGLDQISSQLYASAFKIRICYGPEDGGEDVRWLRDTRLGRRSRRPRGCLRGSWGLRTGLGPRGASRGASGGRC